MTSAEAILRSRGIAGSVIVLNPDWRNAVEFSDENDDHREIAIRNFEQIDAFADAMSQISQQPIRVIYADEMHGQQNSNLMICEESVAQLISFNWSLDLSEIMPYVFLLNVERGAKTARRVESLNAAGAIESIRYRIWRADPDNDPGGGVFGKKDIATRIGATWTTPGLWVTDRYCLFEHDMHRSLPALLAAYLDAYAQAL
ncbi:hypothetical protein [Streptomyces palmae]|uniref:Uncharacterized protein n=1 Tax=Streptomyces palmae TaxID=1701085 RepID=A0A4Z0G9G0_9ACTN|nr:hypothetical protein [Streptomyces palmae]TGA91898.1 hypothetical protein E4099_27985 [Streptomyces palmae]